VGIHTELREKGDAMSTSDDHDVATKAGETAGMFAGVLTGAKIGALAIPIPIVGTFVGGIVGASAFMKTLSTATTGQSSQSD
jgi:phage tail tape-measure protein